MSELYNRIKGLCDSSGINITKMCTESGASRGSLTDIKNGRKKTLTSDTLTKIADYFNVSVDYLLGKTNEKRLPEQSGGPSEEEIKFALFKGDKEISDKAFQEVKDFAEYVRQKYKKEKEE